MVAEGMTETQILEQLELLFMNLESVREALDEGSIVVFERNRIRVRSLPIG
jgi:phosphoribosyl-AMP cyclohydrolase